MATTVGIRFNNIEEERVLGAMLAAGDENVSTHVKRVYFAALDRLDHYDQLKSELDLVRHELRELREQQVHAAENTDSSSSSLVKATTQQLDLLLTLESGIYRMLRQAVPYAIQRDADKVINIEAIEEYLKPDPPDDDHATTTDAVSKDTTNSGQSRPEQSSSGRARQFNPYLEGKRQAQAERARRAAESNSEVQEILYPDKYVVLTAKQARIATPVTQKPTFAQKLKQSFTR